MSITYRRDGIVQINEKLKRMGRAAKLRDFYQHIRTQFAKIEEAQFASLGARGGKKWAPLNPAYAARKRARVGAKPIMEYTGALKRSLTSASSPDMIVLIKETSQGAHIELGSSIPYAQYHQTGRGVPKRQLIKLTKADLQALLTAPIIRRLRR